ncbi:MAG TPA: hypothetical protein DEB05_04185, partial [Firmicutes bacterium]|nr:hypothetical protein [Bacillota bacterium]
EMVTEIEPEGWETAPNARKYKAIIKKAERLLKEDETLYYSVDMESLIRKIKIGLKEGEDPEILAQLKEELHEIIYELTEEGDA